MSGPVTFVYTTWVARYPEFASKISPDLAELLFAEACLYLDNGPCSRVTDGARRLLLLNMITAHLAALSPAGGGTGLVGRISQASEGSVSASADYGTQSASAAFWLQTQYGAAFWQATAYLRTGRYIAPPPSPALFPAGFYLGPFRRSPGF